jgi:N-methylhydantoinase A
MSYYVGLDVGGTFTDCVAIDDQGNLRFAKAPTTKDDFNDGMLDALAVLAGEFSKTRADFLSETARFNLGTTIGTNLIVERKGSRTGLLATAGHGEAILMMLGYGRTAGLEPDIYFHPQATAKPAPLVSQSLIREIPERVDLDGKIIVRLNEEELEKAVRSLVEDEGVTAIAVAFLWSFRNPAHELRALEIIQHIAPEIYVSLSHRVVPRVGEYERTVATVINSYIGTASAAYLNTASVRLLESGLMQAPLVMQVSGGVLQVVQAAETPLTSLGSGPVGGLIGSGALAMRLGHSKVIATDMGGTSFDVGLIVDHEPLITDQNVIHQYRYKLLQLQVNSIACGGGSIARFDPFSQSIRVGPDSAGANPGPICYRRGGTEPTVTDADVMLGLLSADTFLGGRMPLDRESAAQAMAALGKKVGLTAMETAAGILRINNAKAAELIRQQTVIRGYDPRDFVVYAYGGAGPLHAFSYAREMGVKKVVVPLGNGASTLSAYGCATANLVRYFETEHVFTAPFQLDKMNSILEDLEKDALSSMREMGSAPEDIRIERFALMRYRSQWLHVLFRKIPDGYIGAREIEQVTQDFKNTYDALYGSGAGHVSQEVEIYTLRVRAAAVLHHPEQREQVRTDKEIDERAVLKSRHIYWPDLMAEKESAVFDGRFLKHGNRINGPAVVELPFTSVPVGTGQTLNCDAFGNLELLFQEGGE